MDMLDLPLVKKLCVINFCIQINLPQLIVFDSQNHVERMLHLQECEYTVVHYPNQLSYENVKGLLVCVNPTDKFLDEVKEQLSQKIQSNSKLYSMDKLYPASPN